MNENSFEDVRKPKKKYTKTTSRNQKKSAHWKQNKNR